MASKPFNVAVVGYGLSAKVFHIPFVLALPQYFKLHGIVQRSPKPDDDSSKDHPGTKPYRSVDEVYADADVDLVIITSIPETHFEMTKKALENGKNVVCEKPFVPTSHEAQELVDVANKTGKKLIVYQNRRYDSDYNTVAKVMKYDKRLGDIAEFETHFDRHRPDPPADNWKSVDVPGHGAVYDLGTHLIDQVHHFFGKPEKVTGFVGNQRRGVTGGAADSCTVLLQYGKTEAGGEGPLLVTVKAGVVSCEEEQLRFWIRGTKGSFKKFHLDPQEDQLRSGLRPGDKSYALEADESFYGTLTTIQDGKPKREVYPTITPPTYVRFYEDVALYLQGKRDNPVSPEDARDVLEIIEAAIVSSKEGKAISIS
ncbi:putative NAD binding Rossmann fold oxidoreductase [Polychaeton citri CBS 116435]|uniref:NAD binding Rossmann fold oxidoreductase n=1 Tax=Polychaeton citri CBS 116435 TaxID=1314669 RepID=A0A9P4QFE8_9PEZI|nr:putative NAD binding Rossmann fold oxidoreductase [Polychaeton citri CBS 116435]